MSSNFIHSCHLRWLQSDEFRVMFDRSLQQPDFLRLKLRALCIELLYNLRDSWVEVLTNKNVRLAMNSGEKKLFTAKRPHHLALIALKTVNFCKNCVEFCGENFFFTAFIGILTKKKLPYKGSNLYLMRVTSFVIHWAICHLLQ